MYNFDLKKVHDLISFKDICTTDSEYLKEASHLPHIELETDALYVLASKMSVLFTGKLRYYRYVIESEIIVISMLPRSCWSLIVVKN